MMKSLLIGSMVATAALTSSLVVPASPVYAQALNANLNITPRRIVLDARARSATAFIFNQGTGPATFDVSMVDRVMNESGRIEPVERAAEDNETGDWTGPLENLAAAGDMIIAVPRRTTLQPGAGQTIRLRVRSPGDGTPGEFRSHLTVINVPSRDEGVSVEDAARAGEGELGFSIQSLFGISIPVIVRHGEIDVSAVIAEPTLEMRPRNNADGTQTDTPTLVFELRRDGAHSLFGDVRITGNNDELVGEISSLGVYPEIPMRRVAVPLNRAPMPGEQFQIQFIDDDAAPGAVRAEAVYTAG
ncbi:MAG: hypothetical protein V2J26_09125 [Pacificimonas sp.]|nr:hypothetical protein [Pacificimonas sp.]